MNPFRKCFTRLFPDEPTLADLDLRDRFAAAALNGFLCAGDHNRMRMDAGTTEVVEDALVESAYELADKMMKRRQKPAKEKGALQ